MKSKKSQSARQRPSRSSKSDSTKRAKSTVSRTTVGGPAGRIEHAVTDALSAKMDATERLAAGMTYNKNKRQEHGESAYRPPAGMTVEPDSPVVTGSTLTESNASDKTGSGQPPLGTNPCNGSLDRVRVDSTGQALTSNQAIFRKDHAFRP
jgi:catalase